MAAKRSPVWSSTLADSVADALRSWSDDTGRGSPSTTGWALHVGPVTPEAVGVWAPASRGVVVGLHTALLIAVLLERTEVLTSPLLPNESEATAWGTARRLSGQCSVGGRVRTEDAAPNGLACECVATVTRPVAVRVGRCPACVARSWPGLRKLATWVWARAHRAWLDPTAAGTLDIAGHACPSAWTDASGEPLPGLQIDAVRWDHHQKGPRLMWVMARRCPACDGTGDAWTEVAKFALDATPQPYPDDVRRIMFGDNPPPTVRLGGCGEVVSTTHGPLDPVAFAALAIWADAQQAEGDGLGRLIAEWLRWDRLDVGACERWGVEAVEIFHRARASG